MYVLFLQDIAKKFASPDVHTLYLLVANSLDRIQGTANIMMQKTCGMQESHVSATTTGKKNLCQIKSNVKQKQRQSHNPRVPKKREK